MHTTTQAFDLEFSQTDLHQGWVCGRPSGIKPNQWPRSRVNGLPMAHLCTILVPEEYQTKGKDLVAISLFQADDHVSKRIDSVAKVIKGQACPEDPVGDRFWNSLRDYAGNKHPQEIYLEDLINGGWAMIWLSREEFGAQVAEIPSQEDCVYPGYDISESMNPFKNAAPAVYVYQVLRENDPNIGKKLEDFPNEEDPNSYIGIFSERGKEFDLVGRFFGKTHFGGTASPEQATPAFSPFYFEFEENFGGANMGGGNGQIDLLNDEIDWACG